MLDRIIGIGLLCISMLFAGNSEGQDGKYSLRFGYGISDTNNMGQVLIGQWERFEGDTSVLNFDGGYRFAHNSFDWPLDFYVKGGLSHFNENDVINPHTGKRSEDFLELTMYVKAYYTLDFWDNRMRIGFGEGVSFAQEIPIVEVVDAIDDDGTIRPTSKVLNYLDVSFDIDVGYLLKIDTLHDLYLGYTLKHRSGVFGLFNGVRGGINYNMITLEKNF